MVMNAQDREWVRMIVKVALVEMAKGKRITVRELRALRPKDLDAGEMT